MGTAAVQECAGLLATPGMSEFAAAIAGALIGSISGGIISWVLQRGSFSREREVRQEDKNTADRALLLQTLYEAMRAAGDIKKLALDVIEAKERVKQMSPAPPGLSNMWLGLKAQANLPEPITIRSEAVTVFIDHKEAELAMGALDIQAVHHGFLKAWENYGQTYRSLGRAVSMKLNPDGTTAIEMNQAELDRLYPQLKEVSDVATWLCDTAEEYAATSRKLVVQLTPFIERVTGTKVQVDFDGR